MKIYYKISRTEMRADHFYKYIRYVWFGKLIFTIDAYPSEFNFGVMLAGQRWQKNLLRLT